MVRQLLTIFLVASCGSVALGQPKALVDAKVQKETALDWKFVAGQFGPGQAKDLPNYNSLNQKYQLFVPKNFNADKSWPLVLFISAGDNPGGWPAWRKVCEEQGVLFCAPYGAGNNCPLGQRCRIILDVLGDVSMKHRIDPNRTYVSGFSGGARVACTIGFTLPECFGGIVPIGGTNPLPKLTYLKHRIKDRLAVAHVTGETDFNRKEHEKFMHPWWEGIGITSKLWIVPKTGHALPPPELMVQVYQWLESQLPQRKDDAVKNSKLTFDIANVPTPTKLMARMLDAAEEALQKPETTWRGVALYQGVIARWPQEVDAAAAKDKLQKLLTDPAKAALIADQGGAEERKFLVEQSKALEGFGDIAKAIQSWKYLAQQHPGSREAELAQTEIKRLSEKN